MIIAIDGTASSGKSTISRELGKKLNISVLGTGSIYRAITLKVLNFNIRPYDDNRIKEMLETTIIESEFINGKTHIVIDGISQDLASLNSHEVSKLVPYISAKPFVREYVRNIQRTQASKHKDIIVEGRDIGSVVFPNADIKLFIDADEKTRAKRRKANYDQQGLNTPLNEVLKEIHERDEQDRSRSLSPLIMTSDAIIIDTSSLTIEESVNEIIKIINDKIQGK